MERKAGKTGAVATALLLVATFAVTTDALASPSIQSALITTRVFDDDPTSVLSTTNNYPTSVSISETPSGLVTAGVNRHNFRLSTDLFPASSAAAFQNGDKFSFSADLTVAGAGNGEASLQVSPWWSQNVDGAFNFRTTDGEIACFGGRLPFYSFTGSQGVTYTKGTTVRVGVDYDPHSLSSGDPATIEYKVTIGATTYTSGPLAFDEGNPAEDPPHGLWGMLSPSYVGGHTQTFLDPNNGGGGALTTTWSNISYVPEPASFLLLGLGALAVIRRR